MYCFFFVEKNIIKFFGDYLIKYYQFVLVKSSVVDDVVYLDVFGFEWFVSNVVKEMFIIVGVLINIEMQCVVLLIVCGLVNDDGVVGVGDIWWVLVVFVLLDCFLFVNLGNDDCGYWFGQIGENY